MSDIDQPFWRLGNPVLWGVMASLSIAAITLWLAFQETCTIEIGGIPDCKTKLSYLKSAPPNEVGDALAGVAGVLAFIWIIVTVSLQSEELRAQRQVLQLTRKEMEGQREATQDMARSMAAQAAIFEDERKQREWEGSRKALDQLLLAVSERMQSELQDKSGFSIRPRSEMDLSVKSPFARIVISEDPEVVIKSAHSSLENFITRICDSTGALISGSVVRKSKNAEYYSHILNDLRYICELRNRIAEDQEIRVQRLFILGTILQLEKLTELDIWEANPK